MAAMLVSTWARFVTSQVSSASSPESGRRGRRRSSEKRRAPYNLVLVVQSITREEACLADQRKRPSRALTHGLSGDMISKTTQSATRDTTPTREKYPFARL